MAADTGTLRRDQGRATEADRWRVQATSRWAALCTSRGGRERVKKDRDSTMNGYVWGGGSKEEVK